MPGVIGGNVLRRNVEHNRKLQNLVLKSETLEMLLLNFGFQNLSNLLIDLHLTETCISPLFVLWESSSVEVHSWSPSHVLTAYGSFSTLVMTCRGLMPLGALVPITNPKLASNLGIIIC